MRIDHAFTRRAVLAALLAAGVALPALAHHGWSEYGREPFTLNGTVEAVNLGPPHSTLRMSNDEGVWEVVLGPPSRTRRSGLDESKIAVGDEAEALGKRHLDAGTLEIKAERLTVNGATFDIYPERL